MNVNATAQMVTTTQVGCGKPVIDQIAEEAAEEIREHFNLAGWAFLIPVIKTAIEKYERHKYGGISYPVPPHTMTNRGHLRDIG